MKRAIALRDIIPSAIAPDCLAETPAPLPAQWQRMREGHARFVPDQPKHSHQDGKRRTEVASGQQPFGVVKPGAHYDLDDGKVWQVV